MRQKVMDLGLCWKVLRGRHWFMREENHVDGCMPPGLVFPLVAILVIDLKAGDGSEIRDLAITAADVTPSYGLFGTCSFHNLVVLQRRKTATRALLLPFSFLEGNTAHCFLCLRMELCHWKEGCLHATSRKAERRKASVACWQGENTQVWLKITHKIEVSMCWLTELWVTRKERSSLGCANLFPHPWMCTSMLRMCKC